MHYRRLCILIKPEKSVEWQDGVKFNTNLQDYEVKSAAKSI